ncbi:isoprenyl transferase [Bacillus testis]|uniref:isoprenyl transferase n=1 Tax=Bacillus testis TaxID=1622072 RepID=UPI00067E92D3|nr:isoprenyl transferase [Bacillus testis]
MKAIWKRWFNKNASAYIDSESIEEMKDAGVPRHVAIIMDGNGRWANKRSLPRVAGHYEGMKVVQRMTRFADRVGIDILTLYAFSTENWKRPETEVDYLMKLPVEFLDKFLPELIEKNVRVNIMGELEKLPKHTRNAVESAMNETKENTGLVLNLAFNYGSRAEIVQAAQYILDDYKQGRLPEGPLTEEMFSSHLMTKDMVDPDLLIRTSGEIRLSNFMLWQLAYSEFWFTDVLWPDFSEADFIEAIKEYQRRSRRYGGL